MYGAERKLQDSIADPAERARRLRQDAAIWAQDFDANALIVLRRASLGYDAESRAERIRAPLLYVLANSDLRFPRSEEHTSELQSLMRISYAVFCLQKKNVQ